MYSEEKMSIALSCVFDAGVANIVSLYQTRPEIDWERICGICRIYSTNHIITYRGNVEGGYVYLGGEHERGWYRWRRVAEGSVSYERVEAGIMATRWDAGVITRVGILPENWENWDWSDMEDSMAILDDNMVNEEGI